MIASLAGTQAGPAILVAAMLLHGQAASAAQSFDGRLDGTRLLDALRSGGLVIFIRHAATEADFADQVSAVIGDCSTQRTLSEAEWHEARAIGEAFERLRIPVGEVHSSEDCRAWQTAELAFGRHQKTSALNLEPADYTEEQVAAMRARMMHYLAARPDDGVDTVLVGHDDPFEAATGIDPEPMGVAFVLAPDGAGAFAILGVVETDGWDALIP